MVIAVKSRKKIVEVIQNYAYVQIQNRLKESGNPKLRESVADDENSLKLNKINFHKTTDHTLFVMKCLTVNPLKTKRVCFV
jgi:hypothetical protein